MKILKTLHVESADFLRFPIARRFVTLAMGNVKLLPTSHGEGFGGLQSSIAQDGD
jgi:hypothetical protein